MPAFRRKRRFTSRRRARPFKRSFRRSKIRRMMRRRTPKPELKFVITYNTNYPAFDPVTSATRFLAVCTPVGIANGTGVNQRIGLEVKSLRLTLRLEILPNWGVTAPQAVMFRVVIFWGKFIQADVLADLAAVNDLDFYPKGYYRMFDKAILLTNPGGTGIGGPSGQSFINMNKYFKFPRKMVFRPATTDIVEDENKVYIHVVPTQGTLNLSYAVKWTSKLTFIDV